MNIILGTTKGWFLNIGGFLTMVACIMCMVLLLNRPVYYQRERFGLLMATALFEGASVGPLIVIVLDLDPRDSMNDGL